MVVKCKICDVRNFDSAKRCVEAGASFIGLHGVRGIKAERTTALKEVALRIPKEYPGTGVVLVTRATLAESILEMLSTIMPSHLQLHSSVWSSEQIASLRSDITLRGLKGPQIIGVAGVLDATPAMVQKLSCAVDMLLFDRTLYEDERPQIPIEPERYVDLVSAANGLPVFIAGGLTPANVRSYLDKINPWGVDVQTGLEVPQVPGKKDFNKVDDFIRALRAFDASRS